MAIYGVYIDVIQFLPILIRPDRGGKNRITFYSRQFYRHALAVLESGKNCVNSPPFCEIRGNRVWQKSVFSLGKSGKKFGKKSPLLAL